ncbi:MAG TPA: prolyl oligopeptidase family serine peptidase [Clostridia bacterium]|nr:prolyl oligopeptidase family serine peptidase [Clostridia bacterium]
MTSCHFVRITALTVFFSLIIIPAALFAGDDTQPQKFLYPQPKKVEQVDDYHGVKVADPYRWMEDLDSADVKTWVDAENKITYGFLDQIPERAAIKSRMTKLMNYERYSSPWKEGNRYFFTRNSGLQNQSVVYWMESLTSEPKLLIDPNTLSADGTVALSGLVISDDAKHMAYGISASGSDWQEWHIRDIDTGKDLADVLKWVKFSGASWTKDGSGIFYSRYDEPKQGTKTMRDANYFQKLYFHKLGTAQSEDILIYERPDNKEMGFSGSVTDDGRYLIISVWQGSAPKNRVYYKDLTVKDAPVVKLLDAFDAEYNFIDNDGPVFYFRTDKDAARGRIITVNTRHPEAANWKTIIPESKETLEGANTLDNKLVAIYLKDAKSEVRVYDLNGKFLRNVDLPGIGSAGGFGGKRSYKETFYSFTSFTTPTTIYRYDLATGKSSIFRQPKLDFDPTAYEVKQVFYTSKDGTRVPMFIVHKKGIELDGTNPTYLYGYGGFNASETPYFSVSNLVWMEMGGVFALPNLRGGGEYGEDWHQAGTKLRKQNVFDDFIAAAEWLIANKYTSTPKLAIGGRSNGGLLVGAALTQRPDLFGATVPGVGVMDMLRFHKFTIGWGWVSDYGSSDDPEQFKAIYKYSPLHNLKPGTKYPPTFIITADHDDRVVPAHSFKFAATMQEAQGGNAPVLIRIETKAGHGAGKPVTKQIDESTDTWAFLIKALNMKPNVIATK